MQSRVGVIAIGAVVVGVTAAVTLYRRSRKFRKRVTTPSSEVEVGDAEIVEEAFAPPTLQEEGSDGEETSERTEDTGDQTD